MTPNEKAQRLMLVTDIKFRLDEKTGELLESDEPIPDELMKQAVEMAESEFKQRVKEQRKQAQVSQYRNDVAVRCAFKAYNLAMPLETFEDFVASVLDDIESEKQR